MPRQTFAPLLKLSLLGSFQLEGEKGAILLPARKDQLLLAYLVLYPAEHAREKLAALCWGDSSDVQARTSLRTALKNLRKQLGDNLLLADRETVQINPAFPLWVDAREFKDEIGRMKDENEFILHPSSFIPYSGDLLADFYDDWILPEREQYRELYLGALEQLTQAARAASEYERAMQYAHRIIYTDPANERAHQHLMFCHLALGDPSAALKQYAVCARALQTELEVEPARETTALYQWIRLNRGAQTPSDAPAPLAAQITNLPIPLSSFVGRKKELTELKQHLTTSRLLTLTGAGGSGKTRLAIQMATDLVWAGSPRPYTDGVWWVDLAPRTDDALVPHAIAQALGVRQAQDQPLTETLTNFLRDKRLLLALDNCEHLIAACAQLANELLTHCANLKILATSREPLGITGESVYRVPTLSLPTTSRPSIVDFLMEFEGIRLFVERACAVNSNFALTLQNAAAVLEICQRLDGIPLALELAAARTNVLSAEQIAARLNDRFNLLTQGSRTALPRQQTLRAAIDWSYDLLSNEARVLFRRVSVFAGGFTLDAVEMICGDEKLHILNGLSHLMDKSLLLVEDQGADRRYRLLETIREYAAEKLDQAAERARLRDQHSDYFFRMAEKAHLEQHTPAAAQWFDCLTREHDNLRATLEWSLEQGNVPRTLRLTYLLGYFWQIRGFWTEGQRWVERALAAVNLDFRESPQELVLLAQALRMLGIFVFGQSDLALAQTYLLKSLSLYRNLTKSRVLSSEEKSDLSTALNYLGFIGYHQGDYAAATTFYQEALELFHEIGGDVGAGFTLSMLGRVALLQGDYHRAMQLGEASAAIGRQYGQLHLTAAGLDVTGRALYFQGEAERGLALLESSMALSQQLGNDQDVANMLTVLGLLHLQQGDSTGATARLEQALAMSQSFKDSMAIAYTQIALAQVALASQETGRAASLLRSSLEAFRRMGHRWQMTRGLELMAVLTAAKREIVRAVRLFGAATAARAALGAPLPPDERARLERAVESARAKLDPTTFTQAWAEGSALTLEQALADAEEEPETEV